MRQSTTEAVSCCVTTSPWRPVVGLFPLCWLFRVHIIIALGHLTCENSYLQLDQGLITLIELSLSWTQLSYICYQNFKTSQFHAILILLNSFYNVSFLGMSFCFAFDCSSKEQLETSFENGTFKAKHAKCYQKKHTCSKIVCKNLSFRVTC